MSYRTGPASCGISARVLVHAACFKRKTLPESPNKAPRLIVFQDQSFFLTRGPDSSVSGIWNLAQAPRRECQEPQMTPNPFCSGLLKILA